MKTSLQLHINWLKPLGIVSNYKWTVESLSDPDYGHNIITGTLCLIKNQKLRKTFTKGPNFRQPLSLNYSRCKKEIDCAIEGFAGSLQVKP